MFELLLGARLARPPLVDNRFIGEVSPSSFITASALASAVGLLAGANVNDAIPWLQFRFNGKDYYTPKKAIRHTISWEALNSASLITGNKLTKIASKFYSVRLFKGASVNPVTVTSGYDLVQFQGSEWNKFMYHIHGPSFANPSNTMASEPLAGEWAQYSDADLGLGYPADGGAATWTQELYTKSGDATKYAVWRGYNGVSYCGYDVSNLASQSYAGWRPLLEQVADTFKPTVKTIASEAMGNGCWFVWNNDIYFAGGNGSQQTARIIKVDKTTGARTAVPVGTGSTPAATWYWSCAVIGDKVYFFGGQSAAGSANAAQNACVFDMVTQVWTTLANLPEKLYRPRVAAIGTKLYIYGGGLVTPRDTLYEYDPQGNTYVKKAHGGENASDTAGLAVTSDGTYLYACGGYYNAMSNKLKRYNPTSNTWDVLQAAPVANYENGIGIAGDILLSVGGTGTNMGQKVYMYLFSKNAWVDTGITLPLSYATAYSTVLNIDGKWYAFSQQNASLGEIGG
ncbi:virion structural protein [Pseudomonas phage PhiPA3]|uniref:Virion structural protein n=1 Tax=Pseudomonas phage PhiPA3 TaxID=998086 RepID=F8SJV9_BPPA3|nr:virion structural protein [Pseudomonas phage PhiPA3]AEH03504.1 virion structural protein [Pseudomonas phage PhiPA3]